MVIVNTVLAICIIAILLKINHNQKKQLKLQSENLKAQLLYLKFLSSASSCNLWKIRQEIYAWQKQWTQQEQYEAAGMAKKVVDYTEELLNAYNKINENEKNIDKTIYE